MDKTINLKSLEKPNNASHVTLGYWLSNYYRKGELLTLFANMDSAMKYIHSKGFCIGSFNPKDIEILNDSLSQIRFNNLMVMPTDFLERKDIVREDIKKSAFLQIGIHAGCLNCLRPDFLKSNFNDFVNFLPEDIVPYYKGVIERNASVYLGDFLNEKRKRDLVALEKEIDGVAGETSTNKRFVKSNMAGHLLEYDSMNSKVNDSIYKQLNNFSDSAFVSCLTIPTIVAILGVVLTIIILLLR